MTIGTWLKSLWPAWRRRQEREMREELASLGEIAGAKELGNLTLAMENARAVWGWTWLGGILADIRYSFRALRGQPAFVAVAVLSLALAIGANSAVFSLADAMLLRPLPVPNPSALFDVSYTTPDNSFEGMSFPNYRDLREKSRSFSGLAAYRLQQVAAAENAAAPARVQAGNAGERRFLSRHRRCAFGRTHVSSWRDERAGGDDRVRFLAGILGRAAGYRQQPEAQRDRFHDRRHPPGIFHRA